MTAVQLYESRHEYQIFLFATIRDKIRQETKSRIFKAQIVLYKKGTRGDSTGIH